MMDRERTISNTLLLASFSLNRMSARTLFPWMLVSVLPWTGSMLAAQPASTQRDCAPAVIDTVITNGPLCPGDHIELAMETSGDVLGYSWEGPGTGTFFTFTPAYTFSFQILGEYMLVAYGNCGNDTAWVMMTAKGAGAGQDGTLHLCDNSPLKSLATGLGTHEEGGAWTFNGEPHNGLYDTATDHPGDYIYTVPDTATCPGASQAATITVEMTNVGPDMAWSVCSLDPAFNLQEALEPGYTPGGTWSHYVFLSIVPHSGTYDPAVDSSGVFKYNIANCQAAVTVAEIPALPWFEDADQDSLGDPVAMVWSCEQPAGYVADSTDNCNAIPGRTGSPCDDGWDDTVDDMITDSCTCAGTMALAIRPLQGQLPFSIWPNPNAGLRLNVHSAETGPGELRVHDALGRLEMALPITLGNMPVSIPLEGRLAPGIHVVSITVNGRKGILRLTVQ